MVKSKKKGVDGKWIIDKIFIDAIMETSCYGRFSNDPIDDDLVNAKISWNGSVAVLEALVDIAEGDEIFVSYSRGYWKERMNRLAEQEQDIVNRKEPPEGQEKADAILTMMCRVRPMMRRNHLVIFESRENL